MYTYEAESEELEASLTHSLTQVALIPPFFLFFMLLWRLVTVCIPTRGVGSDKEHKIFEQRIILALFEYLFE